MTETVRDFYDQLAGSYHLIFEDWETSVARQAAVLGPILERECGPAQAVRVLDCACGIGTQALGLAKRGFPVTGTDISPAAIKRAGAEAAGRGLRLSLYVADVRHLGDIPETGFDAAISIDNALPHLECDEDLTRAAVAVRSKLRPGGVFVISIRDYDRMIRERPVVHRPGFYSDSGRRRIVFQLWDWIDERRYIFHLYITCETPDGWRTHHGSSSYRAVVRDELTAILESAGFVSVRWVLPAESGFYQPIAVCRATERAQLY